MKLRFFKHTAPVALAAVLTLGATSCADDLNLGVEDPQTNTTLDQTQFLAKVYGTLSLTGTAETGNPDIANLDEGRSGFYRRIFEANELCTDECIWTWQSDNGIPEITNIAWNSEDTYTRFTYYRLEYNITLATYYLDVTEGQTDAKQNRAEARFIRALNMYYFVDLYGMCPFKEHMVDANGGLIEDLPTEMSRTEAFNYIVSELKAISEGTDGEQLMDYAGDDANYGRADKYAAWMMLSRLYLNAGIYTGTNQWQLAKDYALKVINGGKYALCTEAKNGYTAYEQLFMGDNGENKNARQEIIFAARCDGNTCRSYSAAVYPIGSCTKENVTPAQGLVSSQWKCNRTRQALVDKFLTDGPSLSKKAMTVKDFQAHAGDDRAMFYSTTSHTYETEDKTTFEAGFSLLKWSNEYCDPANGSPKNETFPDTDLPLIRLAEAYLNLAEADFRLGDTDGALANINIIRARANTTPLTSISERSILDEWCREFYFEGRRRTDLVRFGAFTSYDIVWDWKGGVYEGTGVDSKYNIYPIPAAELTSNSNMHQNPGY